VTLSLKTSKLIQSGSKKGGPTVRKLLRIVACVSLALLASATQSLANAEEASPA
jgi:hypothetical protein